MSENREWSYPPAEDPYTPTVLRKSPAEPQQAPEDFRFYNSAPATMTDAEILVQSVLDAGVAELITAHTPDAEIAALVSAAELGYRQPIPGLQEALTSIRAAERDKRASLMELADALADFAAEGVQIAALATAAEAGRGGSIEGLARAVKAQLAAQTTARREMRYLLPHLTQVRDSKQ